MKPSQTLKSHLRVVRAKLNQFPASNPRVFGSVAMGTDVDGSDLDILIDSVPGTTLFDLGGLQEDLQDLLGVRVDLLTPADLPKRYREKVLAQAIPL